MLYTKRPPLSICM